MAFIYWLKIQKIAHKYPSRDLTNSWGLPTLRFLTDDDKRTFGKTGKNQITIERKNEKQVISIHKL